MTSSSTQLRALIPDSYKSKLTYRLFYAHLFQQQSLLNKHPQGKMFFKNESVLQAPVTGSHQMSLFFSLALFIPKHLYGMFCWPERESVGCWSIKVRRKEGRHVRGHGIEASYFTSEECKAQRWIRK